MRVRLLTLAIAALIVLAGLPAAALSTVPVVASESVEVVGSIPNTTAISAAFASDAPIMYQHTLNGLVTYDISDPTLPKPLATLPLPNFQNEAMSLGERLGERPDGTKFLIVGFDIYGVTPQDQKAALDYELVVIDVTDPAAPRLRGRLKTESSAHTVSCVTQSCEVAYTSGAYEPFFNPIDLTDLDNPKQVSKVFSLAGEGHDWDPDDAGVQWHVGTQGAVAYDVTDPLKPVALNSTDTSGVASKDYAGKPYNNFILHNSIRPGGTTFQPDVAPSLDAGNVLLVTEEDYVNTTGPTRGTGRCGEYEGAFSTWYIPYLDAQRYAEQNPAGANLASADRKAYGKGSIAPMDLWQTELLASGTGTPAGAFCSAHYFDYNQNGIVAQGWYQQGTRFLDVRDPANIKQVGYFFTGALETWGAYWVPEYDANGVQTGKKTDLVYTNDAIRGIDILRFDFDSLTAPEEQDPVEAPILPQWLAPAGTVPASAPSTKFGYLCRVATSL